MESKQQNEVLQEQIKIQGQCAIDGATKAEERAARAEQQILETNQQHYSLQQQITQQAQQADERAIRAEERASRAEHEFRFI